MVVGSKIMAMSNLSGFIYQLYLIFFKMGSADSSIWGVDKSTGLKQITYILTGSLTPLLINSLCISLNPYGVFREPLFFSSGNGGNWLRKK